VPRGIESSANLEAHQTGSQACINRGVQLIFARWRAQSVWSTPHPSVGRDPSKFPGFATVVAIANGSRAAQPQACQPPGTRILGSETSRLRCLSSTRRMLSLLHAHCPCGNRAHASCRKLASRFRQRRDLGHQPAGAGRAQADCRSLIWGFWRRP
jgi:hypothetical protein